MKEIVLGCGCGTVRGVATHIGPDSGTRVICYCKDCQSFARYLDREDVVLDKHGGTEIYQLPLSRITIREGLEQIRSMKFSPKGPFRWYTACCKTPIGNSLSPSWAFIGLIHAFIDDSVDRDLDLGPVSGHVNVKSANDSLPEKILKSGDSPRMIFRSLLKIITWKLRGLGSPSPFFDQRNKPVSEPTITNP